MTLALVLVAAYLLGSIPSSWLIVRWRTGQDIRRIGSGNPGAMNVRDHVGLRPALVVGAADIGKGAAAVGLAYLAGFGGVEAVLAGLLAVAGHGWSIFLRLDGGHGTGPTVGAIIALLPPAGLLGALLAFVLWRLGATRRLAGLAGLLSVLPLAVALGQPQTPTLGAALLVSLLFLRLWRVEGFAVA